MPILDYIALLVENNDFDFHGNVRFYPMYIEINTLKTLKYRNLGIKDCIILKATY